MGSPRRTWAPKPVNEGGWPDWGRTWEWAHDPQWPIRAHQNTFGPTVPKGPLETAQFLK